jgi:hypothetical protein
MDEPTFHYSISCSTPGCAEPPRYKIAAPWSDGPLRELKNYGLACERHRDSLLTRAVSRHQSVAIRDDEQVGPVEVIELSPGSTHTYDPTG